MEQREKGRAYSVFTAQIEALASYVDGRRISSNFEKKGHLLFSSKRSLHFINKQITQELKSFSFLRA